MNKHMLQCFVIVIQNPHPVAFNIGCFSVRWYALSYLFAVVIATFYTQYITRKIHGTPQKKLFFDPFFSYLCLGIILGGRLGHVLLFDPIYYLYNPLEIVCIWEGGMSFHGGVLGVLIALWMIAKKHPPIAWSTLCAGVAYAAPMGLFLGRICNYLNGELIGRPTFSHWGVLFTNADGVLRHPSQLYEAFFEGPVLWLIMFCICRKKDKNNIWLIPFVFIYGYTFMRFFIEFFRDPDGYIGLLSLGQFYCLIFFAFNAFLHLFVRYYKTHKKP